MSISVNVAGKLVIINAVFRDSFENEVAAPAGATYEWSVVSGGEFVIVEGTGADNAVGKVTPVAIGTALVSLRVSGRGLALPLIGTLEVTVLSMEPETVELNGTVINAD